MAERQPAEGIANSPVTERRDARLQVSRRLDWRFMLPDPALDRVLYFGSSRGLLPEALEMFSRSLTTADPGASAIDGAAFTVVVARNPSKQTLRRAVGALGAGGALYIELDGRFPARRHWRALGLHAIRAEVAHLGLKDISLAWHWPDFDSCTRVVPLGGDAAHAGALSAGVRGAAMRALARALAFPRLVARLPVSLSLVARR